MELVCKYVGPVWFGMTRRALGVFLGVALAAVPPGWAQPTAPGTASTAVISVADFFRRPVVSSVVVSPSGRYLAASMKGDNGRQRLVVLDLHDLNSFRSLAAFSDADVARVLWVNDDRLVISATDNQEPYGRQYYDGLFAIDREGKLPMQRLIARRGDRNTTASLIISRELSPQHRLRGVIRDGSDDVLVTKANVTSAGDLSSVTLLRLDTKTGALRSLSQGAPDHVKAWAVDQRGVPHALTTGFDGKGALYWRAGDSGAWRKVQEFDLYRRDKSVAPDPLRVTPDLQLYAVGRVGGTDEADDVDSLLKMDMSQGAPKAQAILTLKGYDFRGELLMGAAGQLLGVRYLTDARSTHWFDAGMAAIQTKVDALLPGTVNMLHCGQCESSTRLVVFSYSDRQPGTYYLYDTRAGTLQMLMAAMSWLDPQQMATRDMLRIPARDGLQFPVHVTRPPGVTGAAPMVVLVHGGPWSRGGEWAWDSSSQFLASRGYVVVEPEFRGSTGFGSRLYTAGFKQWGLKMQDDVADAALWAVKQGYADPKRICIAGASYGGYATLMGLIRNPEIFRCGVEWVGVSDIDLMYSITWSDFGDQWKGYGMPVLIGDRDKDAQQLADTSPIRLAAKLKQPLLMAYGGEDRRVPIEHGQKMRSALSDHNRSVEWITYLDEGHGWMLEANQIDFWTRVEKFLDKNLKGATP